MAKKREESWTDWLGRQAVTRILPAIETIIPATAVGRAIATNPRSVLQVPAGAVEATVANSSQTPGNYRPAVVDTVPALVGTVAALSRGKRMDKSNVVEEWIENSMDRAVLASERTNETLGIEFPVNTGETMMRVGGGLIIPAKGSGLARYTSAIPRPVRTAATIAADVALPMRQTTTLKGTAAVAGVQTALADQLAENFDPSYESNIYQPSSDRPTDIWEDAKLAGDEAEQEDIWEEATREKSIAEIDALETQQDESRWDEALFGLAALGLGAGAVKYGKAKLGTRVAEAGQELPTFTGKMFRRSRGGVVERAQTAAVQQDQPLRNAADEFLSPQQSAEYRHNSDLINNVSIGSRVASFFRTGRINGLDARSVKLANLAEAYAKELTLDEQRLVSDALLAQSALDDINRTGTHAALNLSRDGSPVTAAQLRTMVTTAKSNPKYAKYMDAITRSYQDLLKFRVSRGMISPEMARDLATARPNYVRMARDLETEAKQGTPEAFNANKHRGPGYERADAELQGVQGVTGVGNPLNNLLDDWASEIRRADVNDLRAFWLEHMSQTQSGLVRRIPNGTTPNTMDGVHTVRVGGKDVSYKITDEIMSSALEYAPRASIKSLEMMRQIAQNLVTGPLGTLVNGFAFFKTPVYDTTMGMLLRPKNVKLGLINEALSKINPNLHIGAADPTALISAYTGAARYMWDDLRRAMAQNLSQQLFRENSALRDLIGDQNVTMLRDRLESAYEASVKSLMDEQGMTSLTMHGSPDPSDVMSGLQSVTPRFASDMARQLANDTLEARRAGQVGPYKTVLEQSNSAFARARSSTIARTYGALLEAMHNGFRYSVVAANRSRNQNIKQLASQARRISVDSAQHGGNDALNKFTSAFMYSNLTIQSLHAVGQMIKQNPARFLGNLSSVTLPLIAMHYMALATDEKAAEQHSNKSAAQKAASVTTFGGAEIPIDPILRFMIGPMLVTLDHATGATNNQWNRPFLDTLATWLTSDDPDDDYVQDLEDTTWANVKANNPFTPEALPLTGGILASTGIDPGMTRVSGEAAPIHTQTVSGFDPDQKRTDSMTNGFIENFITSIGGSFAQNLVNIANDTSRAFGKSHDVQTAAEMGLSRYLDTIARGSGIARPILFDNYAQPAAVTDTNWQIVQEKEKGIDRAIQLNNANVRTAGQATNVDAQEALAMPQDQQGIDVIGTQNAAIASTAAELNSALSDINKMLGALTRQSEGIRNGYLTTAGKKNEQLNLITEQRKYYQMLKRQTIEEFERSIGDIIGAEFEFEDYNPDDYMAPTPEQTIQ